VLESEAKQFVSEMEVRGVPSAVASAAAESGYVVWPISGGWGRASRLMVMDCHYGLKMSGLFDLDEFALFLNGEKTPAKSPVGTPTYKNVRDIKDLREITDLPLHRNSIEGGFTCFRGQTRDYWTSRAVPNPRISDDQRKERIITPSYWRSFLERPLSSRNMGPSQSIFHTIFADPLIYHGIPDWQTLPERNHERYGPHYSISDLEDFPDPESQEYYKRWIRHRSSFEYPLIEQHYGKPTIGLDVTFDLGVAAFFASHSWSTSAYSTKATYLPIEEGLHKGVVYLLRFRDPAVKRTDYLVNSLGIFEHLPVVRPLRQQCGLPAFHAHEISAASRDLDAVILLDASFDTSGLPEPEYLFPIEDDPFYLALLEQRKRFEGPWSWVVDYEF
jgi:hypothetical protein